MVTDDNKMIETKQQKDIVGAILLFLMVLFVFVFNYNESTFLSIPAYQWTNIFICVFIVYILFFKRAHQAICYDKIFLFPFLFILACLLSVLYSYAVTDSLDRCKRMIIMFILMFSVYQYIIRSDTNLKSFLHIYILGNVGMCIYLLLTSDLLAGERLGRTIGDPNLLGYTLAFGSSVTFATLKTEKKIIYLIPLLLMFLCILLTGSRSSFMLFVVGLFINFFGGQTTSKKTFRFVFFLAIFIAVVIYCVVFLLENEFFYKILGIRLLSFYQISQGMESEYHESSTDLRIIFIQRGFEWFLNSQFPLGHGINSFPAYNATFRSGWYSFSHCDYIELLSGVGFHGTFFFFYPFFYWIFCSFKYRNNNGNATYRILLLTLAVQFLLGEIFLCTYYEKGTWIFFALMTAICKKIKGTNHEESTNHRE